MYTYMKSNNPKYPVTLNGGPMQGRIQRLKKGGGGGHTYKMGIGVAPVGRSCLCAH